MRSARAVTVRLEDDDYKRLESEASHLGMPPAVLARVYIRAGLNGGSGADAETRRQQGLAALKQLAALRAELREAGIPPVDAVKIVREGRAELLRRTSV